MLRQLEYHQNVYVGVAAICAGDMVKNGVNIVVDMTSAEKAAIIPKWIEY